MWIERPDLTDEWETLASLSIAPSDDHDDEWSTPVSRLAVVGHAADGAYIVRLPDGSLGRVVDL
jgi:hypothetical protein